MVKELGKFTPYVRNKGALPPPLIRSCPIRWTARHERRLARSGLTTERVNGGEGRREKALGTVYQKHSTVLTRKRMYTV